MDCYELGGHIIHKNQAPIYKSIRDLHDKAKGQRTLAEALQKMHQHAVLTQQANVKQLPYTFMQKSLQSSGFIVLCRPRA